MSLTSFFQTARQGLVAAQAATATAGANIANAETPGYTRRSARPTIATPPRGGLRIQLPHDHVVGGVGALSFERSRSALLDEAVRTGRAGYGGAGESAGLLGSLEAQLAGDGGDAFLGAFSDFSDAWANVAGAPTEVALRETLLAAGDHLARTLRSADARLTAQAEIVGRDLGATVDGVNARLSEVAALNEQIRDARASGIEDFDARDRRDLALDALAEAAPFRMREEANGTVTVTLNGLAVVQELEALPLRAELPPDAAAPAVYATGSSAPLALDALDGGQIGGFLGALSDAIPATRDALDALAADLVARVNAAHATGTGLDGAGGRNVFDPTGTTAASIALDAGLTPEAIAAGTQGPGDGAVATALAGLTDEVYTAAANVLGDLGARVRSATARADASAAYLDHVGALRDGVTRVSIDEEMADLIRFQQSYAASAKVLQTATELFDTILAL